MSQANPTTLSSQKGKEKDISKIFCNIHCESEKTGPSFIWA